MTPGGLSDLERARKLTWDDILPGGYDPYARIKVMDEEGIDVAVLYPSLWLLYGDLTDPQLAAAACRAYNNWMADFCKPFPKRLFGVAPMPLQSVDEAVREMRRVVRELASKRCSQAQSVQWSPPQRRGLRSVLARGAGTRHSGRRSRQFRYADADDGRRSLSRPVLLPHGLSSVRAAGGLHGYRCGGVLARFPKLTVGFLESGIGWLGYWLDRMDSHYEKMGTYVPWLKRKPSEYFAERCYISMDPDETTLKAMIDLGIERNVLWGSDYPHFDCTYPGVVSEVTRALGKLSDSARDNILTQNALRFYRLT